MKWRSRLKGLLRRIPKNPKLPPIVYLDLTDRYRVFGVEDGPSFCSVEEYEAWLAEHGYEPDDVRIIFAVESEEQAAARLAEKSEQLAALGPRTGREGGKDA